MHLLSCGGALNGAFPFKPVHPLLLVVDISLHFRFIESVIYGILPLLHMHYITWFIFQAIPLIWGDYTPRLTCLPANESHIGGRRNSKLPFCHYRKRLDRQPCHQFSRVHRWNPVFKCSCSSSHLQVVTWSVDDSEIVLLVAYLI